MGRAPVPLSDAAFACLAAFLLLHVLSARYIYSFVPYDRWSQAVFGTSPSAVFGSSEIITIGPCTSVEGGLAMVLSPRNAEAYNGQQGDVWDAQKDMSLALLGACLALVVRALTPGPSPASGRGVHSKTAYEEMWSRTRD